MNSRDKNNRNYNGIIYGDGEIVSKELYKSNRKARYDACLRDHIHELLFNYFISL